MTNRMQCSDVEPPKGIVRCKLYKNQACLPLNCHPKFGQADLTVFDSDSSVQEY